MFPVTPLQTQTLLTQETTALETQLSRLQAEETTGQVYQTPADNPLAAVTVMQLEQSLAHANEYQGHLSDATTTLNAVAGALQIMVQVMDSAQSLAIAAQNTTLNTADRTALVQQAQGLIQSFVAQLNLRFQDQYVFAAYDPTQPVANTTTVTNVPPAGVAPYAQTLPTSPVTELAVTINGFEPGIWAGGTAPSVFQQALNALQALVAAIPGGQTQTALTQLQQAAGAITSEQTLVGARLQQAQAQTSQTETWQTTLQTAISQAAAAPVTQVTAQLAQTTQAYQAALQTGAALLQTENLLAFLHP